jgi:hypothetical protein
MAQTKEKRKKTGGREAGTPNKITATVKMMVLAALDELGGKKYLAKLAKSHPQAFATLLGKVMPTQVVGDVTHRYVARMPPPEKDPAEWLTKYGPKQTHPAPEKTQ